MACTVLQSASSQPVVFRRVTVYTFFTWLGRIFLVLETLFEDDLRAAPGYMTVR